MGAHALFSPSSASRWMACPGSLAMEAPFPESDTDYSKEGTCAHDFSAIALTDGKHNVSAYVGRVHENGVEVTDEMAEYCQLYVDRILARVEEWKTAGAVSVELMVEQRVDYTRFIGQPDSFGTSDVIILVTWKDGTSLIDVHDLKYGYKIVYASEPMSVGPGGDKTLRRGNPQMMTYALGAIAEYDLAYDFRRVCMTIHMPRKDDFVDTYECEMSELMAFADAQRMAAETARILMAGAEKEGIEVVYTNLQPSKKACEWCKAKATCPALRRFVQDTVLMEFDDLTAPKPDVKALAQLSTIETLENNLAAVPMVEEWAKAQRTELERRLLAGETSTQFKIVAGKKGNRAWSSKDEAEEMMKSARLGLEAMYSRKLITPTAAEKLLEKERPRLWARIKKLIMQKEGPPSVVPMHDKREALEIKSPTADEFEDLPEDNASDLC